jgi:hypothetical protein
VHAQAIPAAILPVFPTLALEQPHGMIFAFITFTPIPIFYTLETYSGKVLV